MRFTRMLLLGAVAALLVLAACGGQNYNYKSQVEEQPGGGLLSGDDGVFTIYGDPQQDKPGEAAP